MSKRLYRNGFDLQGECPICGGNNLDYQSAEIDDGSVSYDWICKDCKSEGTEWYTMEFYSQAVAYDGKKDMSTDDPNRDL